MRGEEAKVSRHTEQYGLLVSREWKYAAAWNVSWGACLSLLAGLVVAFSTMAFTVAYAEPPRLILYSSFTPGPLPLGIAVDDSCSLRMLTGDACSNFDPSAGDLYVAALAQSRINKFNAPAGSIPPPLMTPPSPFGAGSTLYTSLTVNPSNGDVYVFDAGTHQIEPYDPNTGQLIQTAVEKPFSVPVFANYLGAFRLPIVQIASDLTGHVYVPVPPSNEVIEYDSSSGTVVKKFTGFLEPTGVAVDSVGDLWVADTGDARIEELHADGSPVNEIRSEGVQSVALDGHGDVLALVKNKVDFCGSMVPPCEHLVEYDSAGTQIADIGAGVFAGSAQNDVPNMFAVDAATGRVYVSDAGSYPSALKNLVWVFAPPTVPAVDREFTAETGTSEIKLGALISPGGIDASYRFEYGRSTIYGHSTPFPEGSTGEGLTARAVWATASGLEAGATYHYRVVATNEAGSPVYGPDQIFTTLNAEQAACPNGQLRTGLSSRLPDCRAYELVTAPGVTSVQVRGAGPAASDGESIAFSTEEPLSGAPTGGTHYVASRSAMGWSAEDVIPLESYTGILCNSKSNDVTAFSNELARLLVRFGRDTRASEPGGSETELQECNAEGLQAVPGEPVGYQNLLLRNKATGTYQLVNAPEPAVTETTPADANFQGSSADLSHVVFDELAPLTNNAPLGVDDLYEWDEGTVRLLTVLPNGTPAEGALPEVHNGSNPVFGEGTHSRIVFDSGGSLYVRVDGKHTVQVDKSQGPGATGRGHFQALSADGSTIFFTDESKLTAGSTAETGEPDLYACRLPTGASECELADLTVAMAGEQADVVSVSALGSSDNSQVYFVATGVLAENERKYTDGSGITFTEKATAGRRNLYLWNGERTTFVATLAENESGAGLASPNGELFAFNSKASLTGYNNAPVGGGEPVEEAFLYNAVSGELVCASCNPTGEAPLPGSGGGKIELGSRYVTDAGHVFFDSREALVPSDTNGQIDVYEYENGQPYLISAGTSSSASRFVDASETGDDVFFLSRQQLVPQDTGEQAEVIYDARVGGGFPADAMPPPCSTADACRTPATSPPPIYGAPSSETFSGAGNVEPLAETRPLKPKRKIKKPRKKAACKHGKRRRAHCSRRYSITRRRGK